MVPQDAVACGLLYFIVAPCAGLTASAADLKFLHHLPQTRPGTSNRSGTRIISFLVPPCFRSSCQGARPCITNFGSGALTAFEGTATRAFREQGISKRSVCC